MQNNSSLHTLHVENCKFPPTVYTFLEKQFKDCQNIANLKLEKNIEQIAGSSCINNKIVTFPPREHHASWIVGSANWMHKYMIDLLPAFSYANDDEQISGPPLKQVRFK